jgi:uncharacterized protein YdaU (DUF1376 family)
MSKPTDTWMPLYIGDYLADTGHLSQAEHGAYLLLIMAYWRNGGPLPDDDRVLRRISKTAPGKWGKMRSCMIHFFDPCMGSNLETCTGNKIWRHKRIDAELENANKQTIAKRKGGLATSAKRWGNDSSATPELIASRAPVLPSQSQSPKVSQGEASRSNLDFIKPLTRRSAPARGNSQTETGEESEGEERERLIIGEENLGAADAALALADKKRTHLETKLFQFCKERLAEPQLTNAMLGLMGSDPEHPEQWWFNKIDKLMRAEHWDNSHLTEH